MVALKNAPLDVLCSSPRSTALVGITRKDAPRSNTPGYSVGCFAYGLGRFHDSRAPMRARLQVRCFSDGRADTVRLVAANWPDRSVGQKGPTIESRELSPATVFARRSGNSSVWFQCQSFRSAAVSHSGRSPHPISMLMISQYVVDPMSMNRPTRQVGLADVGVMTDLATTTAPRRLPIARLAQRSLTRSVERGTARSTDTSAWSLRRASHYASGTGRSNHWVEVNRHQPPR